MGGKLLIVFLCIFNLSLFSQKDYYNVELQNSQWKTIRKILRFIESNQPDSVLKCIDDSYLNNNSAIKEKVIKVSKEINKVYMNCLPPEGPITYNNGFNIYKCAYRKLPITYAQFEFYMKEGDANSLVMKLIVKKPSKNVKTKKEESPPTIEPN